MKHSKILSFVLASCLSATATTHKTLPKGYEEFKGLKTQDCRDVRGFVRDKGVFISKPLFTGIDSFVLFDKKNTSLSFKYSNWLNYNYTYYSNFQEQMNEDCYAQVADWDKLSVLKVAVLAALRDSKGAEYVDAMVQKFEKAVEASGVAFSTGSLSVENSLKEALELQNKLNKLNKQHKEQVASLVGAFKGKFENLLSDENKTNLGKIVDEINDLSEGAVLPSSVLTSFMEIVKNVTISGDAATFAGENQKLSDEITALKTQLGEKDSQFVSFLKQLAGKFEGLLSEEEAKKVLDLDEGKILDLDSINSFIDLLKDKVNSKIELLNKEVADLNDQISTLNAQNDQAQNGEPLTSASNQDSQLGTPVSGSVNDQVDQSANASGASTPNSSSNQEAQTLPSIVDPDGNGVGASPNNSGAVINSASDLEAANVPGFSQDDSNTNATTEIATLKSQIDEKASELEALKGKITALDNENNANIDSRQALEEKVEQLEVALGEERNKHANSSEESFNETARISEFNAQFYSFVDNLVNENSLIVTEGKKAEAFINYINSLKEKGETLETKQSELNEQVAKLTADNNQLAEEKKALEGKVAEIEQNFANEKADLETRLQTAGSEKEALESRLEQASQKFEEDKRALEEQIKQLGIISVAKDIEALKSDLNRLSQGAAKTGSEALTAQASALNAKIEALKAEDAFKSDKDKAEAQSKVNSLQGELEKAKNEKQTAETENLEAQKLKKAVKAKKIAQDKLDLEVKKVNSLEAQLVQAQEAAKSFEDKLEEAKNEFSELRTKVNGELSEVDAKNKGLIESSVKEMQSNVANLTVLEGVSDKESLDAKIKAFVDKINPAVDSDGAAAPDTDNIDAIGISELLNLQGEFSSLRMEVIIANSNVTSFISLNNEETGARTALEAAEEAGLDKIESLMKSDKNLIESKEAAAEKLNKEKAAIEGILEATRSTLHSISISEGAEGAGRLTAELSSFSVSAMSKKNINLFQALEMQSKVLEFKNKVETANKALEEKQNKQFTELMFNYSGFDFHSRFVQLDDSVEIADVLINGSGSGADNDSNERTQASLRAAFYNIRYSTKFDLVNKEIEEVLEPKFIEFFNGILADLLNYSNLSGFKPVKIDFEESNPTDTKLVLDKKIELITNAIYRFVLFNLVSSKQEMSEKSGKLIKAAFCLRNKKFAISKPGRKAMSESINSLLKVLKEA